MSSVNDEILEELEASLVAMSDDDFNSIMASLEDAHKRGATLGFEMDSNLASCIKQSNEFSKVSLSVGEDYYDEDYQRAA